MFITVQLSDKEFSAINKVAERLGVSGIPASQVFEDKESGIKADIVPEFFGGVYMSARIPDGIVAAVYDTYYKYVPRLKKLVKAIGDLINAFVGFENLQTDLRKAVQKAIQEEQKAAEKAA